IYQMREFLLALKSVVCPEIDDDVLAFEPLERVLVAGELDLFELHLGVLGRVVGPASHAGQDQDRQQAEPAAAVARSHNTLRTGTGWLPRSSAGRDTATALMVVCGRPAGQVGFAGAMPPQ